MTDAPGAAPAAAEPNLVPINEAPATSSNPVESSGPEKAPEVEAPKPSASVKEAIEKADAKLKEAPKDAPKAIEGKPEAKIEKAEAKVEPKPRDDTGKFAAKQPAEAKPVAQESPDVTPVAETQDKPTAFHEAPKRFSDDAKSAWQTAPEPVRAEIHRAVKELETGISQYRDFVEPLKPYAQMAQQNNTTLQKALDNYIGLEKALKSSNMAEKLGGIEEVFRHAGINQREYAAHLLNQTPDPAQSQQDNVIRELRQEIASLKQQVGGVTQTFQQQREQSTLQEINDFASRPEHARFEELADDIAFFMKTGRAQDLSEAYQLADRLNPAPVKAAVQTPVIPATTTADAHTKGTKSISGSPSPGSSPAAKKGPSPSIRKALESAMARAS